MIRTFTLETHRKPSSSRDVKAGSTSGSRSSCSVTSCSGLLCKRHKSSSLIVENATAMAAHGTVAGCMLPRQPWSMIRRHACVTHQACSSTICLVVQPTCTDVSDMRDQLAWVHANSRELHRKGSQTVQKAILTCRCHAKSESIRLQAGLEAYLLT